MSTLGATALTIADWAKRLDPDGKTASIVELLSQTNEILPDMLWVEGNLPTGHRTSVRTGLPSVTWRLLNKGVAKGKSTTAQVDEGCAMLHARSEIDKDLADLNGNTAAFRLSEAQAFIESMNQEQASTLFYGNSGTTPEEFDGLSTRFSSPSGVNGANVIDAGGSSTSLSIWLVVWGSQTAHGIFPKGSKAGLNHSDLGLGDAFDSDSNRFRAYMDEWQWKCGLSVRDWRYIVRIGSIDVTNLVANSGSQADLPTLMIKATHRIPSFAMGNAAWYMNRTAMEFLDIQLRANVSTGGGLVYGDVDGRPVAKFRGIPVRKVDALLETETAV